MIPTVLLYNLDSEKGRQIKTLCLTLRLRKDSPEGGELFSDELLVMAGLSPRQMDSFLQGFRRKKIPPVDLKAVLTATNSHWNAYQLQRELALERQAMLRGETLHEGGAQ